MRGMHVVVGGERYTLVSLRAVLGVFEVRRDDGTRVGFVQRWPLRAIPATDPVVSNDTLQAILRAAVDADLLAFRAPAFDARSESVARALER